MIHISLFSGIGGADLAAEWAGWSNLVSCEINPFGRKILEYYWPGAYHHDDIHTLTYEKINHELIQRFGTDWRNEPVILTGGFPCQPFSMAGKRKGTDDDRHLWPEMLRLIREIQPEWIVGENVLGFVNWDDGMVFDQVLSDLETEGYETQAYVLPAVSVNAPHRRDRVWIVARRIAAHSNNIRSSKQNQSKKQQRGTEIGTTGKEPTSQNPMFSGCLHREPIQEGTDIREQRNIGTGSTERVCVPEGVTTDTIGIRYGRRAETTGSDKPESIWWMDEDSGRNWSKIRRETSGYSRDASDTASIGLLQGEPEDNRPIKNGETDRFREICSDNASDPSNQGLQGSEINRGIGKFWQNRNQQFAGFFSPDWDNFPTQSPVRCRNDGFPAGLDGITFSKWRNESIKGYGNAWVPQVAYQIFKAINQIEQ